LRRSTSIVPLPTVPRPSSPTWMGFTCASGRWADPRGPA
jgi:hypothetical protein